MHIAYDAFARDLYACVDTHQRIASSFTLSMFTSVHARSQRNMSRRSRSLPLHRTPARSNRGAYRTRQYFQITVSFNPLGFVKVEIKLRKTRSPLGGRGTTERLAASALLPTVYHARIKRPGALLPGYTYSLQQKDSVPCYFLIFYNDSCYTYCQVRQYNN